MGEIAFIRKWQNGEMRNTWSGTPNGLLSGLEHFCKEDQIKKISIIYGTKEKLIEKIGHGVLKALSIDGCDVLENKLESHLASKQLIEEKKMPIVTFAECDMDKVSDTYVFIDCSVDYAFRCQKEQVEFAKYVPFSRKRRHTLLQIRQKRALEFYNNCKGIFTMGEWLKTDLIENTGLPERKIHCVGGGCNVPVDRIDASQKTGNKFLFVGKDFERKNGSLVVRAFKMLKQSGLTDIELYIAGPVTWPMKEPIPEGVKFLGLKSMDELWTYYNLCDVFVMPSKFEAYGIVFAEALIYGLPCIGRDAFSMSDFICNGENGYLLKEDSLESLAYFMNKAISNKEMMQNVKNNKENYIQEYSWSTVVNRMLNVMKKDGYGI